MAEKDDKKRALDLALSQIEKQYGKGAIMKLGDADAPADVPAISTGSLGLDIALGVGGFPHVVAGAVKTFYLATTGDISFGKCLGGFVAPALIGNIIGGTALVAVLAHVQFMAHKTEEEKK